MVGPEVRDQKPAGRDRPAARLRIRGANAEPHPMKILLLEPPKCGDAGRCVSCGTSLTQWTNDMRSSPETCMLHGPVPGTDEALSKDFH